MQVRTAQKPGTAQVEDMMDYSLIQEKKRKPFVFLPSSKAKIPQM